MVDRPAVRRDLAADSPNRVGILIHIPKARSFEPGFFTAVSREENHFSLKQVRVEFEELLVGDRLTFDHMCFILFVLSIDTANRK